MIQTIITKRIFGLADRAGCIDVINLHGTVYENICPKCGKSYSVEYIKNAKGVPLCENCLVSIRPKIILYGEMVDNEVMTKAAFKMEKADVALVLGAPIHASMCQQLLQYSHVGRRFMYGGQPLDVLAVQKREDEDLTLGVLVSDD